MTLREDQLQYVRRFVVERAAIQLDDSKTYLIESRLEALARSEGLGDAGTVVDGLRRAPTGDLAQKVVEAMTTNETSFFRDRLPFDALRAHVLPELIAARSTVRQLRIWCAASSTGQEPYSIAMLVREHFPELAGWRVEIVGTDISTEVLEKARSAVFTQLEVNRGLPAPMLMRWFDQDGPRWRLKDQIRSMVTFRELNLASPWPSMPRYDVVFIRNVMIYFDLPTKERILARVASVLARDGYLFLGAGETTLQMEHAFERLDVERTSCFRPAGDVSGTSPLTTAGTIRPSIATGGIR